MPARTAEIELTFLEKTSAGWEFSVKFSQDFDDLLFKLARIPDYEIKFTAYFPGSGKGKYDRGYQCSEQAMWLLSHLFSNWTEMHEKATKGKTGQGKQEENPVHGIYECYDCKKTLRFTEIYVRGPERTIYCRACFRRLEQQEEAQQKEAFRQNARYGAEQEQVHCCDECGKPLHAFHADINGKRLCSGCFIKWQDAQQQQRFSFEGGWSFADELLRRYGQPHTFRFEPGGNNATTQTKQAPTATYAERSAFTLLGILPTTDQAKIRKAFTSTAKAMHPDTGGSGKVDMDKLVKAKETCLEFAKRG